VARGSRASPRSRRAGGALVTVRIDAERAEIAREILRTANGVDVADRRRLYESEGWRGFHEPLPDVAEEQLRDSRDRYPLAPPPV
jgi:predicted O-methyltransferase YrrM